MLPALTKFYGLSPADVDAMSRREFEEYRVQMEQAIAQQQRANSRR